MRKSGSKVGESDEFSAKCTSLDGEARASGAKGRNEERNESRICLPVPDGREQS